MKPFQFLATACVALSITFLSSCGSGDDKKAGTESDTSTAKMDTATVTTPVPPVTPTTSPARIVVIKQKVANYMTWKAAYDKHDSMRLASGLHTYVIARGTVDSNVVQVVLQMDDLEKAKAFGASKNLKDAMKAAGVIGAPTIDYVEDVVDENSVIPQTDRVLVLNKVKDWDAWKKAFDSHKQARMDAGLIDRVVGHAIGDDHDVSVVFAISDMAKAKAFMASKDLKDKMKEAGVVGAPSFFFFKIVERH